MHTQSKDANLWRQHTETCANALLRTNTSGRGDSLKHVPGFITLLLHLQGRGEDIEESMFHLPLPSSPLPSSLSPSPFPSSWLLQWWTAQQWKPVNNRDMLTEEAFSGTAALYAVPQLPRQGNKGKSALGQFSVQVSIRSIPTHCSV